MYSHNNSQASARSGMSGSCSTSHRKAQDKVSHKKAHKAQKAHNNSFMPYVLYVLFVALLCGGGEIAGAGADRHVLASARDLDLAIAFVALFVERIVPEHVLRAQLGCDLRERIRQ